MSSSLFIGGLPFDIREDDVTVLFKKFGEIDKFSLKKNFAFLTFVDPSCSDEAIRSLDGYTMGEDRIKVEYCKGPGAHGRSGDRNDSRECFSCGKVGHIGRFCPDATTSRYGERRDDRYTGTDRRYEGRRPDERKTAPGGYDRRPMTCFNCQKEGHKSYECNEPKQERDRARSRSPVPRDNYRPSYRESGPTARGGYQGRDSKDPRDSGRDAYRPQRDERPRDFRPREARQSRPREERPRQAPARSPSPCGWGVGSPEKVLDRVDSKDLDQVEN